MPRGAVHPVLRFLRALRPPDADEAADGQLLERFVRSRDEAAFAALLRRHGPLVYGVCVRVLGDTADAEDAFQATFLVLARRAGAVARPEALANWLYGVASRVALKARAGAAVRRRHEGRVPSRIPPDPTEELLWRDLRPVLDEELSRLPAKYREPLVLCHLEGRTHEEAARRLGCPRETVTTRLTRARERLRIRLVRRGLALPAAGLATLLSERTLPAAVPASLAENTARAALGFAAGQGAAAGLISSRAATLTEGVLKTMALTRFKTAAAVLLALAALAGGAGALSRLALAAEREGTAETGPAAPAAGTLAQAAPAGEEEQQEREHSVKNSPPVVVKTVPQAGDTEVDAATTKEIRVTFSKDMKDRSWSWSQISDESFPKTTGKPRYDEDRRTCILPVELERGKTYVIWLNPPKFQGFRDEGGRPAVFYPLVFETKP